MTASPFVQVVMFKSKAQFADADVLAVAPLMKADVLTMEGCTGWELFHSDDDRWVEFIYWDSPDAARRGNEVMMTKASAQRAFEITDESTVSVLHLNRVEVSIAKDYER